MNWTNKYNKSNYISRFIDLILLFIIYTIILEVILWTLSDSLISSIFKILIPIIVFTPRIFGAMKRAKSYIQSITIGEEFIEIKYYQNSTMKQINCRKIDLVIVFYPEFKSKGYWEIYEHGKLKLLQHEAFFDSDTDIIELFDAISKYMPSDSMVDKSRIH